MPGSTWDTAASVAGSAIGGVTNAVGQRSANNANRNINRENNAFNANEARKQRDWEAQMSNSSWRRSVEDMKLAGINPMLLVSKGMGASTPSGASASSQTPAAQGNVLSGFGNIASSAKDLLMLKSSLNKLDADADLSRAQALTQKSQALLNAQATITSGKVAEKTLADTRLIGENAKTAARAGEFADSRWGRFLYGVNQSVDAASGLVGLVTNIANPITSGKTARSRMEFEEEKLRRTTAPRRTETETIDPKSGEVRTRTVTRSKRL